MENPQEIKGVLDVLDSQKIELLIREVLGYEPKFTDNGYIKGWGRKQYASEVEEWREKYHAFLTLMASRRAQGLWINDLEDDDDLELELKYDLILELFEVFAPRGTTDPISEEIAKTEFKKSLTLAKNGTLLKGILQSPTHIEEPPKTVEEEEEKKPSLLDRLLGRA